MSAEESELKGLKLTIKFKGKSLVDDVCSAEDDAIYAVKQIMKCYRWGIKAKVDEEYIGQRFHTWETPDGYVCEITLMSELEQEFYHLKKEGKVDEFLSAEELVGKLREAGDIEEN